MSLMSGPGRFEASVAAALALSMVVTLSGHRRGTSFKLMEIFDPAFFAGFAMVGLIASQGTVTFLERWAGEITNIALVVFVLGTILLRRPFTLQYAKEETDREYWDSPLFLHINAITWVWAASFAVAAACGLYGDAVLKDSDNLWTGWILQMNAMVFAMAFTAFTRTARRPRRPVMRHRPSANWSSGWPPVHPDHPRRGPCARFRGNGSGNPPHRGGCCR